MKKVMALLLIFVLALSMVGCGNNAKEEESSYDKETISVAALKGPTALGMLKMMEDQEKGETPDNYEFELAGAADEILGRIIQGEIDIAAVPVNVASVLYNKTEGKVQLLAVNTLGVLYMLEDGETLTSMNDLKGQTIYTTGQGSTPEYVLRYILTQNNIDPDNDVTIEYKSEASEVAALIQKKEAKIAMLPQPFVTTVMAQNEGLRVVFDITEEWAQVGNGSELTQGCVVVQKAFAEEHPEAVERFLKAYQESVDYVNGNAEEAGTLAEKFGIIAKAAVAAKAIPNCNIVFLTGEQMKNAAGGFLSVLFEANPQAVGGNLPADDFYYGVN